MAKFNFDKVSIPGNKVNDPDWSNPVNFFYKLSHPKIRDLYPIQRDILQNWYSEFKKGQNDKIVSLNTGGGKTLIGLMIAESIRRDTNGKVLYVCPNNFLGKQTVGEGSKYGIKVASYLNLYGSPQWEHLDFFLENKAVCVTNYHAVFNPKSIFKEYEIKGMVFDDSHLSLDLFDEQFTLRIEDRKLIIKISDIFKSSSSIKEGVLSIQDGDPFPLIMIPPLEWHNQSESIKEILNSNKDVCDSLPWLNLKEKIDKTFCFISAKRLEIGLLYPDVSKHYALRSGVHRVYLSAIIPNLDDLTRVFGITPSRIEIKNPDYRPQRLFIFSRKTKIDNPEESIRESLNDISPKTFILVPSRINASIYKNLGASIAETSLEVAQKIEEFKTSKTGMLALANRYDGIDLPGNTCHCLLVDGLPYTGTLKTRFFSEYFHNYQNVFLRSIVASKLIQAFGRTIRSSDDYSIIFILGDKINSWVINHDNRKFFNPDLSEDIEIGTGISASISGTDELKSLANDFLDQTDDWKNFYDRSKNNIEVPESLSKKTENRNVKLAQKEREIHSLFIGGNYTKCLDKILEIERELSDYSKPIWGLYLSIATICCSEIKDQRLVELSARAYGINPIWGMPVTSGKKLRSLQAQRIIDYERRLLDFDWSADNLFDENLKQLGEVLGFTARRPEKEGDGTLDVCWENEEERVVVGFENKINKKNKILSKKEMDQCSGHNNWLVQNYPNYKARMFVVGDIESYNELGSPLSLYYLKVEDIEKISSAIRQIHNKKAYPDQVDVSLDNQRLRIDDLFPQNKVIDLPKGKKVQ